MTCYRPLVAELGRVKPNGKREITFNAKAEIRCKNVVKLPCGTCCGCSADKARYWAVRLTHEAQLHDESCFVTLTYDDENLPEKGSLCLRDVQLFLKKLRKQVFKEYGRRVRFFHCGEYGKRLSRPHYHIVLFGYSFPDRVLFKEKPFRWYRSGELESLWKKGFSTVADLTPASASYVARYTLKKVRGKSASVYYGEKRPEYVTMSRKPGIGYGWFERFKSDVYPKGELVWNGYKMAPPKYYDELFKKESPREYVRMKRRRVWHARKVWTEESGGRKIRVDNSDSFRLPVREFVHLERLSKLRRSYEDED